MSRTSKAEIDRDLFSQCAVEGLNLKQAAVRLGVGYSSLSRYIANDEDLKHLWNQGRPAKSPRKAKKKPRAKRAAAAQAETANEDSSVTIRDAVRMARVEFTFIEEYGETSPVHDLVKEMVEEAAGLAGAE